MSTVGDNVRTQPAAGGPSQPGDERSRRRSFRIGRGGWWLTFTWPMSAMALVGALGTVAASAVAMKWLVERYSAYAYTIHWFETVPVLVLLIALVLNRYANEQRARRRQAERRNVVGAMPLSTNDGADPNRDPLEES